MADGRRHRRWRSSGRACPGSAWRPSCRTRASTRSRSSRRPTRSAARGATTPIRGCTATSRRGTTRIRFGPTRSGRTCCRRRGDPGRTSAASPTSEGIRPHIRFGTEVHRRPTYRDGRWWLTTSGGGGGLRRPRHRDRCAAGAAVPRHPWPRDLRGPVVSLVALGPFGVVAGQANRIDRDRLDRGSDHRRLWAETCGQLKIFQRTAQWICPLPESALQAIDPGTRCGGVPRSTRSALSLLGVRSYEDVLRPRRFDPGWQRTIGVRRCVAGI